MLSTSYRGYKPKRWFLDINGKKLMPGDWVVWKTKSTPIGWDDVVPPMVGRIGEYKRRDDVEKEYLTVRWNKAAVDDSSPWYDHQTGGLLKKINEEEYALYVLAGL